MRRIQVNVCNACNQLVRNATVEVSVLTSAGKRNTKAVAPADVLIPDTGDCQVTIAASATGYYDELARVTPTDTEKGWTTTNPSVRLTATGKPLILNVPVGRIRFAPVVSQPELLAVPASYDPKAILLDPLFDAQPPRPAGCPFYRTVWTAETKEFRTLKNNVVADPNAVGWGRFNYDTADLNMYNYGTWVLLEYGDPQWFGDIRQLVGVWAPFRTGANRKPTVIVQITPNTRAPDYPIDRLPFTGIYPYRCLPNSDAPPSNLRLENLKQPYAELGSRRALTAWWVGHQIYAARKDIFGADAGPLIITPIPALIEGGVVREPLNCREGMGRLVGEVLRFLWSKGLTTDSGGGDGVLRLSDGGTWFDPAPLDASPNGFPLSSATTLLGHSAAVLTMYDIVRIPTLEALRNGSVPSMTTDLRRLAYFAQEYYGGSTTYFDDDWVGLWIMDGIVNPGRILSPTKGSDAARAWLDWLAQQPSTHSEVIPRRICAVYTPSGIAPPLENGLVACTSQDSRFGTAGSVVERKEGQVAWLRFEDAYLRPKEPKAGSVPPPFWPPPPVDPSKVNTHDEVLKFGVGYAAQAFP